MNTANNAANFNGQKPVIDPDDAVLLLIRSLPISIEKMFGQPHRSGADAI